MNTFTRYFLFTIFLVAILIASFSAGYWVHQQRFYTTTNLPILAEANALLRDNGLKPLPDPPALEYGMIRGMLDAYGDPSSVFVEPDLHELESNRLEGKFGGIGVRLGRDETDNHVLYPFPDSPSSKAGIKEGDRLFGVDQLRITSETPIEEIQAALRGPVGQRVKIIIGRSPNFSPQEFVIVREEISLPSVSWHLDVAEPRLGVIEVNLIAASTTQEIEKAVTDLRNRGAVAYVLDLRDNSGGLLTAGVDIARLFLKEGTVMQQQYRGKEVETYKVEKPGPYADIPLTVLINENTASASEIIAGALQFNQRAELIGAPSYGKDTIQLIFELQDGSSLHITAARWWLPGVEGIIGEKGLQPDILIDPAENNENNDQAIEAAIQLLLGSG